MDRLPLTKPEPRRKAKAREKRFESKVIARVRSECVDRDGYCRLYALDARWRAQLWEAFGQCDGPSELAHYNRTHRRSKTVGMDAELRHTRVHAMMLCRYHSHEYDQNRMDISELDQNGCDGRLHFQRGDVAWAEPGE